MKRWLVIFFLTFIFFFTIIAQIGSQVSFPIILPAPALNKKFYDYAGITHAHSLLSTGSGKINEIVEAASKAHCNFLILTDLNTFSGSHVTEGYRDDVAVIAGGEYSFLSGHLLAYDLPEAKHFKGLGEAQIIFNDLLDKHPRPAKEGFLVAAHPFLPEHSWTHLNSRGLKGMEILNLDSIWHNVFAQNKLSVLWSVLIFPFNPDLGYLRLYSEPSRELSAWDEILKSRQFLGFGGTDATANAIPIPDKSFKFPSYVQSFRLMKNHILLKSELTGVFSEDRPKIMNALGNGNFYFSIDLIGDPSGFYFEAQQHHQDILPGQTVSGSNGAITFIADLGRDMSIPHEIVLFKDGERVAASNSSRLSYEAHGPGSYRTVVRVIPTLPPPDGLTWYTWIYSNAIRVE